MTVWICQCLCPDRHCMLAIVGEAESEEEAKSGVSAPLRRKMVEALNEGILNPWCNLCGADRATWRYELRRTKFATMEEAIPHMHEIEAANIATNWVWATCTRKRPTDGFRRRWCPWGRTLAGSAPSLCGNRRR